MMAYGNLSNTGQVLQLPHGAMVETRRLVDANGAQGIAVPDILQRLTALMRSQIIGEVSVVRAVLDEEAERVYQTAMKGAYAAAALDLRRIRALAADLLVAHGGMIPEFARMKEAA